MSDNMTKRPHTFKIEISNYNDGYHIYASSNLVGEASDSHIISPEKFTPFINLNKNIVTDNLSYHQVLIAGHLLYSLLFFGELDVLFQRAKAISEHSSIPLRLLLSFPKSLELNSIPWEILSDGKAFLIENPQITIVRYMKQQKPVKTMAIEGKVRVLFTSAAPIDESPLNVEREEELVRIALSPLIKKGRVRFETKPHLEIDELESELLSAYNQNFPYHILHHCGHGGLHGADFYLAFEKERKVQTVHSDRLKKLFAELPDLKLGIFNVCHAASPIGLIPKLAEINIPSVIGMRDIISDKTALDFAKALYQALFYQDIDVAFGQACRTLLRRENSHQPLDILLPLIYLRTTDAKIFKKSSPQEPTSKASRSPLQFGQVNTKVARVINVGSEVEEPSNLSQSGTFVEKLESEMVDFLNVYSSEKITLNELKKLFLSD